jgi:hypothetical protein
MGANKKGKAFSLRNYLAIVLPFIALMMVPFGCAHRPQVKANLAERIFVELFIS